MGGAHISDAFTIWAKADLHKDQYNTDVTEATKRLIRVRGLLTTLDAFWSAELSFASPSSIASNPCSGGEDEQPGQE